MTPLLQVQMFSAGSGEPLHTDVELATSSDLQSAMSLARAYERRLAVATTDSESTSSPESNMTTSSAVLTHATPTTPWPCLRRLLPEELVTKRSNKECFYCPKKYDNGHKCKSKGVYLLELDNGRNLGAAAANLGIDILQ
jgi:hypothetical protein